MFWQLDLHVKTFSAERLLYGMLATFGYFYPSPLGLKSAECETFSAGLPFAVVLALCERSCSELAFRSGFACWLQ